MNQRLFITMIIGLILSTQINAQTISPATSGEYCPGTNIVFTVTLTGTGYSGLFISGLADNVAGLVMSSITNISTSTGNTTFDFTGRFQDINNSQSFRLSYILSGTSYTYDFKFTKIKSFFAVQSESTPQPAPNVITAPRCQTQNFNISFSNVSFVNNFVTPKQVYGTNTTYEYLLPVGWVLNGITSTGSNWITGTNNVTVTSDMSNGAGGFIQVRAVNDCGSTLNKSAIAYVSIQRPAPALTITAAGGLDYICSGTRDFTINGMPGGALVSWQVSPLSLATIPPGSVSPTVTVTKVGTNGVATLTATVTHCTFTYNVVKYIVIGTPPPSLNISLQCPEAICIATGYNATSFTWSIDTHSGTSTFPNETSVITFKNIYSDATICVSYINACGTSAQACDHIDCPGGHRIAVRPNPSRDFVFVSLNNVLANNFEKKERKELIYEARIVDKTGNTLKVFKYKAGEAEVKINVADLAKDVYMLQLFDGKIWSNEKLLVE